MKEMSRTISALAMLLMSLGAVSSANAALRAVGPVSAVHGLPAWYQDVSGLTLQPCLDQTINPLTGTGLCILPPAFDPAITQPPLTITQTGPINATNFPGEAFYWIADVVHDTPLVTGNLTGRPAKLVLRMALEGNALTPALAFMRINIQQLDGLAPLGTYQVSTPYGDITFTADALGEVKDTNHNGQTFRNQIDALPPLFDAILPASFPVVFLQNQAASILMDQLLVWNPAVLPAAPLGFIGDPNILHSVVKSGDIAPAQVTFSGTGLPLQTITQFSIAGKVFGMDVQPGTTFNLGANNIVTPVPAPQTVTVKNLTANAITFADLNLPAAKKGADAADFNIVASTTIGAAPFCLGAVAIGASCSFDIVFTPTASVPAHAARTATITLAPVSAPPLPPVILTLSGTAQVNVTAAVAGLRGSVTPGLATQTVGAGSTVNLSLSFTPDNKKFKVKAVEDVVGASAAAPVTAPSTFNVGNVNHAVTATFMPSGDLDMDGTLSAADAMKALKIVAGVQTAIGDDNAAIMVAPLDVNGKPAPDVARTQPNIGDVLVILRRAFNLEAW